MKLPEEITRGKWNMCKPFYEKHYKVSFTRMPKARDVDFLYENMINLRDSLADHMEASRIYLNHLNRPLRSVPEKVHS